MNPLEVKMGKFICAVVLVHFAHMVEGLKLISIGNLRSAIPTGIHINQHMAQQLECFDSPYNDEQGTKNDATTIQNLDGYIRPLGALGCFILINNFRGSNIPNLNYPVIIRFPRPVARPSMSRGEFHYNIVWLPHHLYPNNSSRSTRGIIKRHCQLSKFLASFWEKTMRGTSYKLIDYCLRVIKHKFSFFTKPWNCEAQLGLFPLTRLYQPSCQIHVYPRMFRFDGSHLNTDYMLSLSKPTINLIVTDKFADLRPFQELMVAICNRYSLADGIGGPYVSQSVFLHGEVSKKTLNKISGDLEFVLDIVHLVRVLYKNAVRSLPESLPLLVKYGKEYFAPDNFTRSIQFSSSPSPESMSVWNVHGLTCQQFSYGSLGSPEQMVTTRRSQLWVSIFKNYTFEINREKCCTNGVIKDCNLPDGIGFGKMYLSLYIHDPMINRQLPMALKYEDVYKSLRFISCTSLAREPLMFKELISMYDRWIWICLIWAMIFLAVTFSFLGRRGSLLSNFLAVVKVLVGQGDPFMHRVLRSAPSRSAVVTFLFMGIILNEGYKNENMYHIISPRKVIIQEKLSQLVQGKFTVYTRALKIEFHLDRESSNPDDVLRIVDNNHAITASSVRVISEVSEMTKNKFLLSSSSLHPLLLVFLRQLVLEHKHWYSQKSLMSFFLEEFKKGTISFDPSPVFWVQGDKVFRYKNFTQAQVSELEEIYKKYEMVNKDSDLIATARSAELVKTASDWDEKTLFNFLQNCTRAALILPEHLSLKYATRLRLKDHHQYSIGREVISPKVSGVHLKGWIPPVVIRRVKWMETTGIWEWHSTVVRKWKQFNATILHIKPTKATMSGNVSIIFSILPVGFLPATIGFVFELIWFGFSRLPVPPHSHIRKEEVHISAAIITMLTEIANLAILHTNINIK